MKKYVGVFILAFLSLFVVNSFAQTTPPSGTGLSFNGTNQYVRIPSADAFNIAANESFTVSCWVKVPAWPSAMGPRILSKRNIQRGFDEAGQNASYELWTGNASSPNHYFANNVVSATASTNIMSNWIGLPASTATWYHLCMVIDKTANDINLYQNGVMSDNHKASPATTLAGWVVNNRFDLLIGCDRDYSNNTSSHFFNGEIADVRFYKKALTAAEVTTDMTATVTGATAGLVAAYDFKNMSGATVPDIKGTNPGTLMNFAPQGDVVAAPTFSPAAGHYTDAQNVTLASTEAGAKIYYTVDGSTPTTASTEYTAAIVVSENTTIKAIAAKAGMVTSAVVSAAYTIGAILPDYCKYDGNRADMRNRLINSINVTGATVDGASQTFSFDNAITYQSSVYSDKTANVLNATQGDELVLHFVKHNLSWMHFYAFVDYNQNHVFDADELVSYSYYTNVAGAVEGVDSKGATRGEVWCPDVLPSFIIPTTAKTGPTRVRFNVAWNDINPCGYAKMGENSGTMLDFTINIAKKSTPTEIDNSSSDNIVAYVNGDGHIVVEGAEIGSLIEVYDIAGAGIAKAGVQSNSQVLSSVQLSSASYLVKISDGTKSVVRRVIK